MGHDLGCPHATREDLADALMTDIDRHGAAAVVALAVSHADCEDLADRIRRRLQATGHLNGPELVGPAWSNGERRYAAGDRLLVHGTLTPTASAYTTAASSPSPPSPRKASKPSAMTDGS